MRNVDLVTWNRYNLYGGDSLQVDVKIKPCVEEVEVLITAEKRTQFVNDLFEVIWDFDKHSVTTLTGYIDNRAYIIKVTDILRIFSLNQKVYIQTANGEFLIKSFTDFLIILAPLRKCRNCLEYQAFPAFCVSEDTPHIMAYRSLIWRSKVVKP